MRIKKQQETKIASHPQSIFHCHFENFMKLKVLRLTSINLIKFRLYLRSKAKNDALGTV